MCGTFPQISGAHPMASEIVRSEAPEPPRDDEPTPWSTRRKVVVAAISAIFLAAAATAVVFLGTPSSSETVDPRSGETSSPRATPDSTAEPTSSATPEPSSSPDDTAPTPEAGSTTPVAPLKPEPPVPIAQPSDITAGLTAAIVSLEAVEGEARGPGEVGGPAVRVTFTITNSTSADASLATAVVTAYYGPEQTPALELDEPGASALPTSVAPGQTATGVYVFTIPREERGQVRIMVDYSLQVPPLLFEGAAPA
jgi:hypothetical protein